MRAGTLSIMVIRYGVTFIAVIVVAASTPAGAQTPPVSIPAKDFGPVWTGFYVGAAFGAGGAVNRLEATTPAIRPPFPAAGGHAVLAPLYCRLPYPTSHHTTTP